jgi:hypothetical protein
MRRIQPQIDADDTDQTVKVNREILNYLPVLIRLISVNLWQISHAAEWF